MRPAKMLQDCSDQGYTGTGTHDSAGRQEHHDTCRDIQTNTYSSVLLLSTQGCWHHAGMVAGAQGPGPGLDGTVQGVGSVQDYSTGIPQQGSVGSLPETSRLEEGFYHQVGGGAACGASQTLLQRLLRVQICPHQTTRNNHPLWKAGTAKTSGIPDFTEPTAIPPPLPSALRSATPSSPSIPAGFAQTYPSKTTAAPAASPTTHSTTYSDCSRYTQARQIAGGWRGWDTDPPPFYFKDSPTTFQPLQFLQISRAAFVPPNRPSAPFDPG